MRHNRELALLTAAWVATRTLLLLCVTKVIQLPGPDVSSDVEYIYQGWSEVLRAGSYPMDDVSWQYPPAAALAVLAPLALPFLAYTPAFLVVCGLCDALVLGLLLRAERRRAPAGARRRGGCWVWVAGVPLLGPTAYARYDLMVTAVVVAALLTAARRPVVAGTLTGFGTLLKGWPALLLLGTRPGRATRRQWGAALATGVLLAVTCALVLPGAFAFLTYQRDRGVEVESLGALVFHIARHYGWHGEVALNYGSVEYLGPWVETVGAISIGLTVLALGWLLWWRVRAATWTAATHAEATLAAVLLFTTTSRVLSPQYMIWLVGLAAVVTVLRGTAQRLPVALVLLATGVTLLEFPLGFGHVVAGDPQGVALLAVRNALLVAASLLCCVRLWRGTVGAPPQRDTDRVVAEGTMPAAVRGAAHRGAISPTADADSPATER